MERVYQLKKLTGDRPAFTNVPRHSLPYMSEREMYFYSPESQVQRALFLGTVKAFYHATWFVIDPVGHTGDLVNDFFGTYDIPNAR
jgi:hypothetical protein